MFRLSDDDIQGELLHQEVNPNPTGRQKVPFRMMGDIEQILRSAFDKYAPFYDTQDWS